MGCSIVYPIFLFFTIYNFFVRLLALHICTNFALSACFLIKLMVIN